MHKKTLSMRQIEKEKQVTFQGAFDAQPKLIKVRHECGGQGFYGRSRRLVHLDPFPKSTVNLSGIFDLVKETVFGRFHNILALDTALSRLCAKVRLAIPPIR